MSTLYATYPLPILQNKKLLFFFSVLELNAKGAWTQISYSQSFEPFKVVVDNVPRLEESTVSPEEFIEKYEKPYLPVVIRGSQDSWKARHKWTVEVRFGSSPLNLFLVC